jgi:hypothetical protein
LENIPENLNLPSRSELLALSLFGSCEEERQLCKRLLVHAPPDREPENALMTLHRLYPEGSEAARMADESPAGQAAEDIINSQPEEGAAGDDDVVSADIITEPVRPAPEPEPEPEEPTSLAYKIAHPPEVKEPVRPKFTVARPSEPTTDPAADRLVALASHEHGIGCHGASALLHVRHRQCERHGS